MTMMILGGKVWCLNGRDEAFRTSLFIWMNSDDCIWSRCTDGTRPWIPRSMDGSGAFEL